MSRAPAWTYRAEIERWVDGDTVDVAADLGFYITVRVRLRLYGVNTPERGQAGYNEARAVAEVLAPVGTTVIIKTYKEPDKYGRFLAQVWAQDSSVADALIVRGMGRPYYGGTKD
jgi:micrococcal nuclease